MAKHTALIVGLSGLTLTPDEAAYLRDVRPCGIILFARNVAQPDQIRQLVAATHDAIGTSDLLVLIDQEGGRVRRLRPPLGRDLPPAANYALLHALDPSAAVDAAFRAARLLARDLKALSINTNCAPVLDLPVAGAHDIIGDRAYGMSADTIIALARAVAHGHQAGGVLPIIKHIPGHGRAFADSHHELPHVAAPHAELSATDFAPFAALADQPAAMTAHVVYEAIDPAEPASTSKRVINDIIRREIGFDGFLMSDDLSMQALSGTIAERCQAVIAAGCDVALHCNGDLAEMRAAAAVAPILSGASLARFERAFAVTQSTLPFDETAALADLERVLNIATQRVESV
jgi:beta-N-acetylhexosaminidase